MLIEFELIFCGGHLSPVPVQFDLDKIRTEMKPIKMARAKAYDAQKKVPRKILDRIGDILG